MDARVKLAVIDFNENVNRKNAVIAKPTKHSGKAGDQKFKFQVARQSGQWVCKAIKEDKTYVFIDLLMAELLKMKDQNKLKTRLRDIPGRDAPKNIAASERPDKEIILNKYNVVSRFRK